MVLDADVPLPLPTIPWKTATRDSKAAVILAAAGLPLLSTNSASWHGDRDQALSRSRSPSESSSDWSTVRSCMECSCGVCGGDLRVFGSRFGAWQLSKSSICAHWGVSRDWWASSHAESSIMISAIIDNSCTTAVDGIFWSIVGKDGWPIAIRSPAWVMNTRRCIMNVFLPIEQKRGDTLECSSEPDFVSRGSKGH
jgi:hypothetical protein